jgi:hypothetical protein
VRPEQEKCTKEEPETPTKQPVASQNDPPALWLIEKQVADLVFIE